MLQQILFCNKHKIKTIEKTFLQRRYKIILFSNWSYHIYAWERAKHLVVILSSQEFTFRSSNMIIACSTVTSFSPLMEKNYFLSYFSIQKATQRYRKSRKLKITIFAYLALQRIIEVLEDFSAHFYSFKNMSRFLSFTAC